MKSKTKRRNSCLVNARRWAAYATAGAASAIAATESAEAGITYSGVLNTSIRGVNGSSNSIIVPLSTTGGSIFALARHFSSSGGSRGVAQFGAYGQANGFAAGGFLYVSNLPYGANVSTQPFSAPASYFMTMAWTSGYTFSQFLGAGQGYMGFKFDVGAGTQYGWARVDMDGAPYNGYDLVDFAYSMPGQGIHVGDTGVIVPEPGSLGLLAAGAIGLLAWRHARGKKVAA